MSIGMTYSISSTGTDIVGESVAVAGITHEDCCLDHVHCRGGERDSCVSIPLI
jgi:hypothetical protein